MPYATRPHAIKENMEIHPCWQTGIRSIQPMNPFAMTRLGGQRRSVQGIMIAKQHGVVVEEPSGYLSPETYRQFDTEKTLSVASQTSRKLGRSHRAIWPKKKMVPSPRCHLVSAEVILPNHYGRPDERQI